MSSFSPQVVGAEVLRDTMVSISDITTLVPLAAAPAQFKIFYEHVPDWVEMPYFIIQHIAGGHEQSTPDAEAMDSYFKIVIQTTEMLTAVTAITALSQLNRLDPVMTSYETGNPDSNPIIRSYATIRETLPIYERYVVQNVPYFRGGGIYRIRLIKE